MEFKQCPICNASITLHWQAVTMWRCINCGLLMRNPQPTNDDLSDLYDTSWSAPETNTRETGGTNPDLANDYVIRLLRSLGQTSFSGMNILDYGAGRGATVNSLASLGAQVTAIEPFGYKYLRKQGINAFQQLDDIPEKKQFDGIVSIDVIEHLPNPLETVANLQQHLSSGGWIFLATPNAAGISGKVKRASWKEARNPGHLFLFAPKNLELLLDKAGYSQTRRLKWFVRYSKNPAKRILHIALHLFAIDGELRYLAYNS